MSHDLRRGEIRGRRSGPGVSEAEHYDRCQACGGYVDLRDLAAVLEHEGPPPHPGQDQPN